MSRYKQLLLIASLILSPGLVFATTASSSEQQLSPTAVLGSNHVSDSRPAADVANSAHVTTQLTLPVNSANSTAKLSKSKLPAQNASPGAPLRPLAPQVADATPATTPTPAADHPTAPAATAPTTTTPVSPAANVKPDAAAPAATTSVVTNPATPEQPGATPAAAEQQPGYAEKDLVALAEETAIVAFNYDYQNYQNQFAKAKGYFTDEAWQAFSKALEESKNIDAVKNEKMEVSAKVNGVSKMIKQTDVAQQKLWQVRVPVHVIYKGEKRTVEQNLAVDISLITVGKDKNPRGLAVTQFIAKTS